jgi:PHD/YefM family antitoxin component YafN of YafNO toxin-antitoxin module
MKSLELSGSDKRLTEYIQTNSEEPLILTLEGRPVAAVVSLEEVDLESIALANNPYFQEIIESSIKSIETGPNLTIDQMREKYNIPRKQPRSKKRAS